MNTVKENGPAEPGDTESVDTESVDTVIVGGGQAGLALGYHLVQQRRDFVILDAHARVGDAWRQRWDSLRLFTPAKYDGLPGRPFPGDRLSFPTKDEQADYLEHYAARFGLPLRTGVRVDRLWREDGRHVVAAGERRWRTDNVVLATGGSQLPVVPEFAQAIAADVTQLHSSAYRNPAQLQPGNVLVVGVGNSGAEIALELSRTHPTWLAGTPSAEIPVRHGRTAARFVLPVIRFVVLHVLTLGTPLGRKAFRKANAHAAPLIRTRLRDLVAAGVQQVPRVVGVRNGRPVVGGDRTLDVANVIWCTGYRDDFGWVDLPGFGREGRPPQHRGIVESVPGVYLLGQEFLFAAASATVPGVCRDARFLARHLNPPSRLAGGGSPHRTGAAGHPVATRNPDPTGRFCRERAVRRFSARSCRVCDRPRARCGPPPRPPSRTPRRRARAPRRTEAARRSDPAAGHPARA